MQHLYTEYYLEGMKAMNNLPEIRRRKLKEILNKKKNIRVMEASNGLTALIAENTKAGGKEYDAMWVSSLCDSALKGKPDNEVVDFTSRMNTINEILEVTTKPIILDGDTGGKTEHFTDHIKILERAGVSAIIIEDKKGLKQNSIFGNKAEQQLEDVEIFAEKIRKGKEALLTDDFMIFARIESFIADQDLNDALERAEAYVNAGADGIMIHSYKTDGQEVTDFLKIFKDRYPDVITVVVPTTYSRFKEEELNGYGANIVIYANHLLRSSYAAMVKTAERILEDESCEAVSREYCVSMEEILALIGGSND